MTKKIGIGYLEVKRKFTKNDAPQRNGLRDGFVIN
jgi:hypothetical protein